jgi:radical SAM superfamily enzyme YgiQ (UPF0313 family)
MKITFNIVTPKYFGLMQLSLLILKSYIHDKDKDIPITLNRFFCEDGPREIAQSIHEQNPDIAAFSLYVWTEQEIRDICLNLKELNPDILVVIGGNIPTFQADYFLEQNDCYDVAVRGEAEESFYLFLKEYISGSRNFATIPNISFRQNGQVISTPNERNYLIENAHYPLLLEDVGDTEMIYYESSRGCKNGCKYCAYNMNYDANPEVHYYPWEKVESDLQACFQIKSLKRLDFTDSTVLTNRDRGLKLLKLVNKLNHERCKDGMMPVEIGIDVSLEDFDDEILYEVKRMHINIYGFGLQSTDREVLRLANRRFDKEKFTHYFQELTRKDGSKVNLELMFGLPGDTYEKFRKSLEFSLSELNAHFVVCFRFAVLPGSRFKKATEKYGITCEEYPPYYVLSVPTFSQEDLQKAEVLSFYLQLTYTAFRGIKKIIDRKCFGRKVETYDILVDMLVEKYGHFFDNKNLRQGQVYDYFRKLNTPEFSKTKQAIQKDLRKTLERYLAEQEMAETA